MLSELKRRPGDILGRAGKGFDMFSSPCQPLRFA